jgi:hypothetical protein
MGLEYLRTRKYRLEKNSRGTYFLKFQGALTVYQAARLVCWKLPQWGNVEVKLIRSGGPSSEGISVASTVLGKFSQEQDGVKQTHSTCSVLYGFAWGVCFSFTRLSSQGVLAKGHLHAVWASQPSYPESRKPLSFNHHSALNILLQQHKMGRLDSHQHTSKHTQHSLGTEESVLNGWVWTSTESREGNENRAGM